MCTTTTTNEDAPNGYGTAAETGLTINVLSGATVTGTDNGFSLGSNNTVNNSGTITTLAARLHGNCGPQPDDHQSWNDLRGRSRFFR